MFENEICEVSKLYIDDEIAYEYVNNPNYYVTKTGKIYSIYKVGGRGMVDINNPHLLSYGEDKDGYYRVVLSLDGKKKYIKVHTIVAEQFLGKIPENMVINHKDGDKHNNNIENLEITNVKYNTIHAHKNGLVSKDIRVNVEYRNTEYSFASLEECMKQFPDLSKHYLKQLRDKKILFSMVLFQKVDSNLKVSKINAYYNGELLMQFENMKAADSYFEKPKGSVSATMKNNEYRKKINQYKVSFPNVSTIENDD